MQNFVYDIPTKIFFGEGQIRELGDLLTTYGTKVLLVYGGGSIKKNGIYDIVCKELHKKNLPFTELSGVEPNPKIDTVRRGVSLCRKENLDIILAIGGGSTIDCAKVIAASTHYMGDAWDVVKNGKLSTDTLPIIAVPTLAATGSEMDTFAVISNPETKDKIGTGHPSMRPKAAILDPTYTYTVNAYHTAAGTADIMSHILECYFSNAQGYIQDRMAEALLITCIHYGKEALANPTNYEARANLQWASCWAINNLIQLGKNVAWSVHPMEHELSAYYDITHGIGLAILTPHWMEYVLDETSVEKFKEYGIRVWNIDSCLPAMKIAKLSIQKTRDFFADLGIPMFLRDVGIDETHFLVMAEKASISMKYAYRPLTKDDIVQIFKNSL